MKISSNKIITALVAGATLLGTFGVAGVAFAESGSTTSSWLHRGMIVRPSVVGTVTAVSGNTLTVSSKNWMGGRKNATSTPVDYSVDASTASIIKNGATTTISSILVNDMVTVKGTITGTNVVATVIRTGMMGGMKEASENESHMKLGTTTPILHGDGNPIVGGKVTAVSSTTLTITNASNATYTVNASSAKIVKPGTTGATLANIVVGDTVIVQGTINGTTIVATSVVDQSGSVTTPEKSHGFMGMIGVFFSHLFGFF